MSTPAELAEWQDALEAALALTTDKPIAVRIYQQTASTQDIARSFAPKPTLIVADQQSAGRGRLGRQWVSSPGASVLMSLCWPMQGMTATHDRVSMLTGVAVARAVEGLTIGRSLRLKWPNDVMLDGRKLAGILIEAVQGAFIIGIGLNVTRQSVADPSLAGIATCLQDHGCNADRLTVIETIVSELHKSLRLDDYNRMLEAWRARAALGQTQTFENDGQRITGEVIDLDPDHGLIVRRDSGELITLPAATTSVVK